MNSIELHLVFIRTGIFGESPKIGVFRGKNPKIPKLQAILVPKISPIFFGDFRGWNPKKSPKLKSSPSPKNPQFFSKDRPRPRPVPEISGRGRGKPGIGAPFYHTSLKDRISFIIDQFWNSRYFCLQASRKKVWEFQKWLMIRLVPSFKLKTKHL